MKDCILRTGLVIISTAVALLLGEVGAQLYMQRVAYKGKLFQPDSYVGWKPIAGLRLRRRNSEGELWSIGTDAEGVRGQSSWASDAQIRVLIVGDSFAFGEGVNIEDRFDSIMQRWNPGISIINLGVMGYGTDQQFIRARPYLQTLRENDILIVLTYQNDFYDIVRMRSSGRSKPWFELLDNNVLKEHGPDITWIERLRDRSYIFAKLSALLEEYREFTETEIAYAANLYEILVRSETSEAINRGVRVLVASHGTREVANVAAQQSIESSLKSVCAARGFACLSLDEQLGVYDREVVKLSDGHWNVFGHEVVANAIGNAVLDAPLQWQK